MVHTHIEKANKVVTTLLQQAYNNFITETVTPLIKLIANRQSLLLANIQYFIL